MADFQHVLVSFDENVRVPHSFFFKKHFAKEGQGQTLFVSNNIPPYCNEDGLRNIFKECGKIISISLKDNPHHASDKLLLPEEKSQGFKMAYIVFEDEIGLDNALKMIPNKKLTMYDASSSPSPPTGMKKWIEEYCDCYPPESSMQNNVDAYMRMFDKNKAETADAKKNSNTEADDEGWTTIPVKKKTSSETTKVKKINKKFEKKKNKDKELMNFYLFQQREEKREKIATLRQKFEEDKNRITQMRNSRKFKPF